MENQDLYGNDLNGCGAKTETADDCQKLCGQTNGCVQFTWLDKNFDDDVNNSRFKQCCMKNVVNNDIVLVYPDPEGSTPI